MKRNRGHFDWIPVCHRPSALLVLAIISVHLDAQVLPPLPVRPEASGKLAIATRLLVHSYRFEGNTAFTDAELAGITQPYANREIDSDDMEQARRAVSLHYLHHGYVNSGAVIPDQSPTNGIVTIRVVEGVLTRVDLHDNRWFRDRYLRGRLQRWSRPPLNLNKLQEGLQLLRQNPNVRQINAELKPGTAPGEGVLDVHLVDQQPFRVGLQVDNQRPPSVGAEQFWFLASDLNLTGHGDALDLKYGIANHSVDGVDFSGWDNMEGSYVLPLNRYDTSLALHADRLTTTLVEETFVPLDITSLTVGYGVALRQPVYQTASQEAAVSIGFDYRQNNTWLLGEPFTISPGAVQGEMKASVLRLSQEWLQRGRDHVIALRSTFNVGLDAFDATDSRLPGDPDAKFLSWVGQGQYVQRLFKTQNQLILRVNGQWTTDPLLALEQLSAGGSESVRGYRENQLVRDRGIVSSVEFRIPVFFDKAGAGIVHLAPFFDYGAAWGVRRSPSPTAIYSTGIGLLVTPNRHVSAQLYWGYRLRHVDAPVEKDPQDLGLHFRINVQAF